jgi:hypothetical protein
MDTLDATALCEFPRECMFSSSVADQEYSEQRLCHPGDDGDVDGSVQLCVYASRLVQNSKSARAANFTSSFVTHATAAAGTTTNQVAYFRFPTATISTITTRNWNIQNVRVVA